MWITINREKFIKRWEYHTTLPFSWETCSWVKKQQLELDTKQWTGSKLGKEYVKAVYCHPVYLPYKQMLGWMNHKLESKLPWEILTTSDDTTLIAENEEELKSLLMRRKRRGKEEWEKAGLKLNIQKMKIMASSPITDGKEMGNKWKQISFPWVPKSFQIMTVAMKLWLLLLGRKAMTNLDSVLKSRDITLPIKVHIVKAMVFPGVMYGCESWTRQTECQKMDTFKLWCWRRLLRVPQTARRSNQSILKEISLEYSLEGLVLKLKL